MEYKWRPDPDVIARERVKELLSPEFIAKARQRYQGDPYNQGDIKPEPTVEELKQDRDMRKEDYIDDGTLDEQGQPNKLQMIQDGADAIYKLLQIVPALGGFHQLQMSSLDQDSPMWPNLEGIGVDVPRYIDDEEYGIPVDADHPDMAELVLPGDTPASNTGGLGSMNRDALERWIKENNMGGAAADKIRKKWKGLHGGLDLPFVQGPQKELMIADTRNLQKGPPPVRGLGDIINQQAETYRGKDDDKMLELQKLAAPLIKYL